MINIKLLTSAQNTILVILSGLKTPGALLARKFLNIGEYSTEHNNTITIASLHTFIVEFSNVVCGVTYA